MLIYKLLINSESANFSAKFRVKSALFCAYMNFKIHIRLIIADYFNIDKNGIILYGLLYAR